MKTLCCSQCKRPACWLIQNEPFCEAHKEGVIERWGVDRFMVKRLELKDHRFVIRGMISRARALCD